MNDTVIPDIPTGIEINPDDEALIERIRACLVHPLADSFRESLGRLAGLAQGIPGAWVRLWRDFAPLSFNFSVVRPDGSVWIHGGLIYHGDHDGGGTGAAPTFSVNLQPQTGWVLHT